MELVVRQAACAIDAEPRGQGTEFLQIQAHPEEAAVEPGRDLPQLAACPGEGGWMGAHPPRAGRCAVRLGAGTGSGCEPGPPRVAFATRERHLRRAKPSPPCRPPDGLREARGTGSSRGRGEARPGSAAEPGPVHHRASQVRAAFTFRPASAAPVKTRE